MSTCKFAFPSAAGAVRAVAAGLCVALSAAGPAAAEAWPSRVAATYDVEFNGIGIGSFDFQSETEGANYRLTGNGKLSLLFGAFKWSGNTQANGAFGSDGPAARPRAFSFAFQSNKKAGSTKLSYTGDTVTAVMHEPPKEPKDGTVPVLPAHLKGVLDPMSAILAVSKGTTGNPCSRRIPVYDGKERFDLMLSPKGVVQLTEARPSGQPGTGYVCRVKYVPISGHKVDQEKKYISSTEGIEIVLRPIPSANIFVPYKVTVPTIAGPATITARKVDITTAQQQQIALSH